MNISFQNPQLLVLLPVVVPVVFFLVKGYRVRQKLLHDFTGEMQNLSWRSLVISLLSTVFLVSLLLQAAGPRRILNSREENRSADFVFLIDVSRSMAAAISCDASTRLDRARSIMAKIVTGLPSARFALTGFSGLAFVLSEMTYNRKYLLDVIENAIFVEVVPIPGSDLANALYVIIEKKTGQPPVYQDLDYVVLFSDGDFSSEDIAQLDPVIPFVQGADFGIISVGLGTDEGLPIPTLDENRRCVEGQFERADGKEYYTHLVEKPLKKIAVESGGAYFHESDEQGLISFLESKLKNIPGRIPPQQTRELGPVLLGISTVSLFLLILLRRL